MNRIIYPTADGIAVIIPTGELSIAEVAEKDVPAGVPYKILAPEEIPSDRTFRNAWKMGDGCIEYDLDKCKTIGHIMRRSARAEEFAPHDEVIAKQIPGVNAAEAETARQVIRDKYDGIQLAIDAAVTFEDIKVALGLQEHAPASED